MSQTLQKPRKWFAPSSYVAKRIVCEHLNLPKGFGLRDFLVGKQYVWREERSLLFTLLTGSVGLLQSICALHYFKKYKYLYFWQAARPTSIVLHKTIKAPQGAFFVVSRDEGEA